MAVRVAATRRLGDRDLSHPGSPPWEAVHLLSVVGPDPESVPRLCEVAWDPHGEGYLRDAASQALATLPAPDLSALLDRELDSARAASDIPRLVRAAVAGIRGGSPRATQAAEEVLREGLRTPPDDPALVDALDDCAKALIDKARFTEEERRKGLFSPGTCAFVLAARKAHFFFDDPGVTKALLDALEGHPVCAAAAAQTLLFRSKIEGNDPRLSRIAREVPLAVRSALFWSMFYHAPPTEDLWPLVEEILISPDPAVTAPFRHRTTALLEAGFKDRIAALEPRITSLDILTDLEEWRDRPPNNKPAPYWQDEILESEEDEEDEDEDEDEEDEEDSEDSSEEDEEEDSEDSSEEDEETEEDR